MLQGYLIEWATNRPTLYNHCFCPETPLSNFRQNPLSVCNNAMELYQKFFSKEECIITPHKEDDLLEAKRLKYILKMTGLIKKRKNKFYLTRKGESLIKDKKIKELFNELVLTLFNKWNWGAFDGYSELPLIQTSVVFNIHLLNKKAKNWISDEELGGGFLKAFPYLIFDVNKGDYFEPRTEIIDCFNIRFLYNEKSA